MSFNASIPHRWLLTLPLLLALPLHADPLEEIGSKLAESSQPGEVRVNLQLPLPAQGRPVSAQLRVKRQGGDCLRTLTLTWNHAFTSQGVLFKKRRREASEQGPCASLAQDLPAQASRQLAEMQRHVLADQPQAPRAGWAPSPAIRTLTSLALHDTGPIDLRLSHQLQQPPPPPRRPG